MPNRACIFKLIDVMLHTMNTHSTLNRQIPDTDRRSFFQDREDNFFGVSLKTTLFSPVVTASLPLIASKEGRSKLVRKQQLALAIFHEKCLKRYK